MKVCYVEQSNDQRTFKLNFNFPHSAFRPFSLSLPMLRYQRQAEHHTYSDAAMSITRINRCAVSLSPVLHPSPENLTKPKRSAALQTMQTLLLFTRKRPIINYGTTNIRKSPKYQREISIFQPDTDKYFVVSVRQFLQ